MSALPKIVAVVEDDASMLKGIERLLGTLGLTTELYLSAEAYLNVAAESAANCLLLDIHLPGMSGIELKRRLVASGSRLPIIFMSSSEDERTQQEAIATGCVAYLQKPFISSALIHALSRAASSP
jgi:FixJ family two-component response regulator